MSSTPLISLENVSITRSNRKLFDGLHVTISGGERIGIIGPNGSGKSTLSDLFLGVLEPDLGKRVFRKGLRCRAVSQLWTAPQNTTVMELIRSEAESVMRDIPELAALEVSNLAIGALRFGDLMGHEATPVDKLSGGQKKRLQILLALLGDPHLLVMDEPTNHMDLETTEWLEESILKLIESPRSPLWGNLIQRTVPPAFVLVSHDRAVLDTLVTQIIELQSVGIQTFTGNYSDYLEANAVATEAIQTALQSTVGLMKRELEWLSRSPKARTTKQQARIKRSKSLNEKLELLTARATKVQRVEVNFNAALEDRPVYSKQILIEASNFPVSIQTPSGPLNVLSNFDLVVRPGMRIAIVGPNGCGKSSLLTALAHATKAADKSLKCHINLRMGILDQSRTIPDEVHTLRDLLLPHGGEYVRYGGRSLHIASFLDSFRFSHQDLDVHLDALSGGQLARALLAATLLGEPNLLFLDEPTNDLDLWMLRDLEEGLLDFKGALIFTSHDRYFLQRLATDFIVLEKNADASGSSLSKWKRLADLEQAMSSNSPEQPESRANLVHKDGSRVDNTRAGGELQDSRRPRRQTFKDSFRQGQLEEIIPKWEEKALALNHDLQDAFAKGHSHEMTVSLSLEIARLNEQINAAYEELEQIMSRSQND